MSDVKDIDYAMLQDREIEDIMKTGIAEDEAFDGHEYFTVLCRRIREDNLEGGEYD